MRLVARVWNADYDAQIDTVARPATAGPVYPISANIGTKLDQAGRGRATFQFSPRVFELLQARRVVEIWYFENRLRWDNTFSVLDEVPLSQKIGTFIIEATRYNPEQDTVTASGPTLMARLGDTQTLPGLEFINQTVQDVVDDLAALGGWTVDTNAELSTVNISLTYGGGSVLRNIQRVVESQGFHIRQSDSGNTALEIGSLGAVHDTRIEYTEGAAAEMGLRDDAPYLIESAEYIEDTAELVNLVYPYGAGDGDARLTLENSTRSGIDSLSRNGQTHYYLQDASSRATYGDVERQVNIKRIAATGTSDAAIEQAANVLYDAANEWLQRHKDPYREFKVTITNVTDDILPGDKIRIVYRGWLNRQGVPYQWLDVDEDFWVLAVENRFDTENGRSVGLTVATVDRYKVNATDIVVGMVESISVNNVAVKPYPVIYSSGPFRELIDASNDVTFDEFRTHPKSLRLTRANLVIYRRSFTATATSAESVTSAGGGDHNHRIAALTSITGFPSTSNRPFWMRDANGGSLIGVILPTAFDSDLWTEGASGTHQHTIPAANLVYGINRDTDLPEDLTVTVNGTDVTPAGGIFPSGNTDTFIVIDVTDEVLGKVGGWRDTTHDVVISAASGQGVVVGVIEMDVDIQSF